MIEVFLETGNLKLFVSVFHFLSEFPSKEKHKDRNSYKEKEKIRPIWVFCPIVNGFKGKKNSYQQIEVLKKTIDFI